MAYKMNPYIVYAKTNFDGYITAVNSSAFLTDTTGWVEIDSGYGDKYHHAQGNYFPEPIRTPSGAYRYKLADGDAVKCTAEEINIQERSEQEASVPSSSLEARITMIETENIRIKAILETLLHYNVQQA